VVRGHLGIHEDAPVRVVALDIPAEPIGE
jgi:hypothetical protein